MSLDVNSFSRILVIGGNSFFGSAFSALILSRGFRGELVRTSRNNRQADDTVSLDPLDRFALDALVRSFQPDLIVNFAGLTQGTFHELVSVNALLPAQLCGIAENRVPGATVVLIGSSAEYGVAKRLTYFSESSPLVGASPYAYSKRMQSAEFNSRKNSSIRLLLARPFNLYGNQMPEHLLFGRVLSEFEKRLSTKSDVPINVGFLGDYRDWIDVGDASRDLLTGATQISRSTILNLGTGVARTARDMLSEWVAEKLDGFVHEIEIVERHWRLPNYSVARK